MVFKNCIEFKASQIMFDSGWMTAALPAVRLILGIILFWTLVQISFVVASFTQGSLCLAVWGGFLSHCTFYIQSRSVFASPSGTPKNVGYEREQLPVHDSCLNELLKLCCGKRHGCGACHFSYLEWATNQTLESHVLCDLKPWFWKAFKCVLQFTVSVQCTEEYT